MSAAVLKILHRQQESLYRLFLSKTDDQQESQDLLQDLYESVLNRLDTFAAVEDQTAWLFRAAHNRVIDWYRKRDRQRLLSLDRETLEDTPLLDLLVSPGQDLEDQFLMETLLEALDLAVEALPEKLRRVITAQTLEGRTFRELSEEWDIPMGTLLSRKREALRLLAGALDEYSDIWEEMNEE
ncbi:MAG: RNA polymerase sigma factor [Spirochaetales bacterium]|nr:RNA polymerase sigma factor [Spirochaetales bacterium]